MDWQPIEGWPLYEVSANGYVRKGERLVGQWESDQGYRIVRLSSPRRLARVHRLVATAFIPNPFNKPFVNHIDCCRCNNAVSNLEWCTQIENLRHSESLGRMQRDYWIGKRSPNSALSDEQVREIRRLYTSNTMSWESIGRHLGVSKRSVGRVVKLETYTYVQ